MADAASASKRYCSISAAVASRSAWPARRRASRGAQLLHHLADDRNGARRHAELGQAEPDQQADQRRIRRHLAAQRHRNALARGGAAHHAESAAAPPDAAARRDPTRDRRCDRRRGVYWIRSLVPIVKKSTSGASRSAASAADGTSIIAPTLTRDRRSAPHLRAGSRAPGALLRPPVTNGNMMRSGPWADARTSARSCVRSTLGIGKPKPEAAQPGPGAAALRSPTDRGPPAARRGRRCGS